MTTTSTTPTGPPATTAAGALTATTAGARADAVAGVRAMAPLLAGVAPMGLVIGVAAAQGPLPPLVGLLTGPLVYSGSAQLAVIDLLRHGGSVAVVGLTVLAINARLVLYAAAMARHWRDTPAWWRLLAAYLLIDPSFLVGSDGYARRRGHAYYLGGAVVLWLGWQVAIAAGALVGSAVPASLELDFLATLYLVAVTVPKATDPTVRVAIVLATVGAAAGALLPVHAGPVLGIVVGVTAAMLHARRTREIS